MRRGRLAFSELPLVRTHARTHKCNLSIVIHVANIHAIAGNLQLMNITTLTYNNIIRLHDIVKVGLKHSKLVGLLSSLLLVPYCDIHPPACEYAASVRRFCKRCNAYMLHYIARIRECTIA